MNGNIEINGNNPKWEDKCWQNAENQNSFVLINFNLEMVAECHAIAKKHGYELKGRIPAAKPGVCQFIPRNYHMSKIAIPYEFKLSGYSED
jgi:hypothetical protein